MNRLVPIPTLSASQTIGAASAIVSSTLDPKKIYQLVGSGAFWYTQGAIASSPTATAGAGSTYVPANTPVLVHGGYGARLVIIQDGASTGKVSLTEVTDF